MESGTETFVVIMGPMAACHGWLVNGVAGPLPSLSAARRGRSTILSCASILHFGAEAYGWLMPSLASGNNIIENGGNKREFEIRGGHGCQRTRARERES